MKSLHLTLLGGFNVCDESGRQIVISGTKPSLLLAYLALRQGEAVTREKLMSMLWSDRGESQARSSLRQSLWALRHAFKDMGPNPLMVEGETLALDLGAVESDVTTLEGLVAKGTPGALESALSLYQGPLLEGLRVRDPVFENFLRSEQARFHRMAADAGTALLDQQLKAGLSESAAEVAKRLLTIDPLQETAHQTLMQYYADKGQASFAFKQYQQCREMLKSEFNVKPAAKTEQLFNRLRLAHSSEEGSPEHHDGTVPDHDEGKSEKQARQQTPSIAVLPFQNLSGDPEQEYFSDGITEDIITALSRLRWFLVIARNSTFVYKGKAVDVKQVGRELGVDYVVEGSVQKAGNRIRISAQLIDGTTGNNLWAEKYDRELADIFDIQDEITQTVVATIEPKLVAAEGVRSQHRSGEDLNAWQLVMRAMSHYGKMTSKESQAAIALLEEAVQKYPDYGPAHSLLAFALLVSGHVGWIPESDVYRYSTKLVHRAGELARHAAELDDEDPWARLALGYLAFSDRQTEEAVRQYKQALELNPNFAIAYGYLGWALVFDGQSKEAIRYFQQALRMSPHDPLKAFFYSGTCVTHYYALRYEKAIEWGRNAIRERPGFTAAQRILCASLAMAGKTEETAKAMARLREIQPNISIVWIEQHVPYTARAMPHFLHGMRKAGLE